MGRETNIHSIKTLEKQIEEGKGNIIELKRARNLLNISTRVPPEILGYGETHRRIGRSGTTVPEPLPSTWCWIKTNTTLTSSSTNPSRARSEVTSCKTPYDKFIYHSMVVAP